MTLLILAKYRRRPSPFRNQSRLAAANLPVGEQPLRLEPAIPPQGFAKARSQGFRLSIPLAKAFGVDRGEDRQWLATQQKPIYRSARREITVRVSMQRRIASFLQ